MDISFKQWQDSKMPANLKNLGVVEKYEAYLEYLSETDEDDGK